MHYQDILHLVKKRRSLYPQQMLENIEIEEEKIDQLLEVANHAPSHKRTEPWRFIVMKGNSLNEFIDMQKNILENQSSEAVNLSQKFLKLDKRKEQISHIIAICMARDEKERIPVCEEEYAVACSVQNMLLTCDSLGIIGYWSTGATAFTREMHSFLELNEKDKCLGYLMLGTPKEGLSLVEKSPLSTINEKVIKRY